VYSIPLMMTITPDGGTVFIGSAGQIVVQPVNWTLNYAAWV
jgi:hypothetical protein